MVGGENLDGVDVNVIGCERRIDLLCLSMLIHGLCV